MKRLTRRVLAGLVILGAVTLGLTLYKLSPWRDVEVALGMPSLPRSVRHLDITVDAWADYVVKGYVEVSPQDFDRILQARAYVHSISPAHLIAATPKRPARTSTSTYYWRDGSTFATLEADDSRTWLAFEYSTE